MRWILNRLLDEFVGPGGGPPRVLGDGSAYAARRKRRPYEVSFVLFALILLGAISPFSFAQEDGAAPKEARLEFKEVCWFDDELATAMVFVDAIEQPVVVLPEGGSEVRFFDWSVQALENDERGQYVALIEFMPQRSGVRVFPAIRLDSDEKVWQTKPRQIVVGEAHESPEMSFEIQPLKTRVYAGEPVRLDFIWRCALPVGQLRDFRLSPRLFNDASVSIVVPRSTAPEDEQFGMPVGGRRVIARRILGADTKAGLMGEIRFSIFARFEKPGAYDLARTRLLCSRMLNQHSQSNQYAAYFNNGLFESADRSIQYEKIEAFSNPITLEVLPLPEKGREESFSGLFDPRSIAVSVTLSSMEVGQLMEIRVEVLSDTASEMLKLPPLNRQSSLRNRFWVGKEMNEVWRRDGRTFVLRARPLSVEVDFFPSLSIQVFNAEAGSYETKRSELIPLTVTPRDGKTYFDVSSIPGAEYSVLASPEGIWHNDEATIMNDVMNGSIGLLADGVWIFIFLSIGGFLLLLPRAREFRRRALDRDYRRRKLAYRRFCQASAEVGGEAEALRTLIADSYSRSERALTARDAVKLLRRSKGEDSLIEQVESILGDADEVPYDPQSEGAAARVEVSELGKQVFKLLGKASVVLLAGTIFLGIEESVAADWESAESAFATALEVAEAGGNSNVIEARFAEAALQFEACGEAGIRSGLAWYNAGNAWFKSGEIGRAIANYRQAEGYRPFDSRVTLSLEASRALRIDAAPELKSGRAWPLRWKLALLSISCLIACAVGLFWIRLRTRLWASLAIAGVSCALFLGISVGMQSSSDESLGVLIVDEAYGRKGPSYSYRSAFLDPLHNGIEMTILATRSGWVLARLEEGSECWFPRETVQVLEE
jgi:tetratricopeptide (TPR) repeat protein